jgi:hypothetical protein
MSCLDNVTHDPLSRKEYEALYMQEKDTKRLRDTIAGLKADVRESRAGEVTAQEQRQSLEVKVASLEATNRALTAATTNQKEMLQASQLALSKSVTLDNVHRSAARVLTARH